MLKIYCNDNKLNLNIENVEIVTDRKRINECRIFVFNITNNLSCYQVAELTSVIVSFPKSSFLYYSQTDKKEKYTEEIHEMNKIWLSCNTNHIYSKNELDKKLFATIKVFNTYLECI